MGFLQTKISGHPVAWFQQHRITRNQIRSVYLMLAIGTPVYLIAGLWLTGQALQERRQA